MSAPNRKKPRGGRSRYNCSDNKNNFRNQDSHVIYSGDRKKSLCDLSIYTIARFLMGNEVQIITQFDRYEGVLRTFDSTCLGLSKVFVFDNGLSDSIPIIKTQLEFKEVLLKDILLIKMLNGNGKLESVIIDQEISQRKQLFKPNLNEDKNLVPYFDEEETQLHNNDDDDDLNASLKSDQNCWYDPETMLKENEERFNVKKTWNSETMEEYTTQIDKSDPLLKEKMEYAERIAKEIENESNMKRGRIPDDSGEQDEEIMFSAVMPSVVNKSETPVATPIRLNPNAPEFRPRNKQTDEVPETVEEVIETCQSMSLETSQQHQQQQQQMMHRLSFQQYPMAAHQMNPQIQAYPAQRIIPNQWPVPIQAPNSGQFITTNIIPPYQQVMSQHLLPQRQMQSEAPIYYQFTTPQFIIPQDHSLTGVPDTTHLYSTNLDTSNPINHTHSAMHHHPQLRPVLHIPNLPTTNQMSIHHQQQQNSQQQQQLNTYYQQPHQQLISQPINPASFPHHLIMNQQQQPQLQNGTMQGYITNGRQ